MSNPIVSRLFNSIPFRNAIELHQKLKSDADPLETRRLLRSALRRAGFVQK